MNKSDLLIMLAAAGALLFVVLQVTKKASAATAAAPINHYHDTVYDGLGMYALPNDVPVSDSNPFGMAAP
jgi:hypothetical protein